jgi:hypothetical protein
MATIKLNEDIRTRHLEAFEEAYIDIDVSGLNRFSAAILRAAATAGWFDDTLHADDVADMKGGEMRKWAKAVSVLYAKINEDVSPN